MSSTRGFLRPYKIFAAADMSTGTITSAVTTIYYLDNVSIQLNFTGNPTGTFQVEGSLDYYQDQWGNVVNSGNWIPLTLTPPPVAVGVTGQILLDLNQLSFPNIRVTYTDSGGGGVTATLDGYISAKQV